MQTTKKLKKGDIFVLFTSDGREITVEYTEDRTIVVSGASDQDKFDSTFTTLWYKNDEIEDIRED